MIVIWIRRALGAGPPVVVSSCAKSIAVVVELVMGHAFDNGDVIVVLEDAIRDPDSWFIASRDT